VTKFYKTSAEVREKAKAWYQRNRALCIARNSRRNKENKESRRAVTRKFYQKHKERWVEWRAANPEKVKKNSTIYVRNRLARKANAPGRFTFEQWMQKVAYHGWKCFYCHKQLTLETLTIDHRKALSRGGSNWLANLVPACKTCNCKKWANNVRLKEN
jgi:5-methylcytosine-specific restriction endonuclease McrA